MDDSNICCNGYTGIPVAILGASGFIGRWVARALCARGAHVALVVRNRTVAQKVFFKYGIRGNVYEVDLMDPKAVRKLFEKIKPCIVFNLAGYGVDRSEQDETIAYQINAHLVKTISKIMADLRRREWLGQDIIHVGSAFEYGVGSSNLSEDSIPKPTTLYGMTKLAGTEFLKSYCQTHGIKGLTARLFTVYGSGEHDGRLLPSLLDAASRGISLQMTSGEQQRDFTYVEDVAEGLLRLGVVQLPGKIVNLATGHLTSVRNFAETAARVLAIPEDRLLFGSIPHHYQEMKHSNVELNGLQQLIAWVPQTAIEEGIRKTFDFENIHRTWEDGDG
jgi:nucleoside-diphosphate-sugar epimerase